ncbi:MAG: aminomethyl-transferring glycine dehydrogenase subunit GcvPA [Chloroflexi bacterium]|nr:aminomethyl-transferring glycine dehydrogenase subunit GcvPA [Chloroflexota bacterium]
MYTPHTPEERQAMLRAIGVERIEDLFVDVPAKYRYPKMNLPPAMTEMEATAQMQSLAEANEQVGKDLISFLGAGAYHHYVPAVVDHILRRGEFYTAYTPYQPEVSQGTLHAIFEYQSLMCALTGMEVANASMYDGATAVAEAVNMAYHVFRGKRPKAVLAPSLHPQYIATTLTYYGHSDREVVIPEEGPTAEPDVVLKYVDDRTSLVMVQYPDFFGRMYDFTELAQAVHERGALFGVAVNPMALGLFKAPGEMGADIVTAEGQPLGIPLSFGGPYLGVFATRKKYVRKIAGRLVGETVDSRGQRAYVLTLTAREQHIRRARATSNICTNNALMALAATVYLGLLGKQGLRQVAELNYHKAHYAAQRIAALEGYELAFPNTPFFNEFTVKTPVPASQILQALLDEFDILGGYDLGQDYPELDHHLLIAVTEMNTREQIDLLAEALNVIARRG